MASLESVLGVRVKITTVLDTTVTGKVYALCPVSNTITLAEDASTEANGSKPVAGAGVNYRILKTSFVKDLVVVEKPKKGAKSDGFTGADAPTGPVDVHALRKRELAGTKRVQDQRNRAGAGVSPLAQHIFDTIYKTLPCHWKDKSIVVLNEVYINPPYLAESCVASSDSKSLQHVKRIVSGAHERFEAEVKGG